MGVHLWPSAIRTRASVPPLVGLACSLVVSQLGATPTEGQRPSVSAPEESAAPTVPSTPDTKQSPAHSSVAVLVAGSTEYGEPLANLLDAMLIAHQQNIRVVHLLERPPVDASAPPGRAAFIELRLDSSVPTRWQLHLWRADRHWVRTLEGGIARDAAAIEAAALIAARAVVALLEEPAAPELEQWASSPPNEHETRNDDPTKSSTRDAAAPIDSIETPSQLDDDSAPSERQADGPRPWAVSLAAAGSLYAPSHGPQGSAALGLEYRAPSGWTAGLEGALALPTAYDSEFGSFELRRTSARASVGYRTTAGRWSALVALGGTLERTSRGAARPDVGVASTTDSVNWSGGLGPAVSVAHTLASFTELGARVSGTWFFSKPRFESGGPDGEVLLSPYTFRPRLDFYVALLL